jgi:probable phosphoglycerate mutase
MVIMVALLGMKWKFHLPVYSLVDMSKQEHIQHTSPEILPFKEWASLFEHTVFTRHGKTLLNEQGVLQGSQNISLSETGLREVWAWAPCLPNQERPIGRIYSSPMQRAVETAEIAANELSLPQESIKVMDMMREYDFGSLEGAKIKDLEDNVQHNKWTKTPITLNGIFPEKAELFTDFLYRINRGVLDLRQKEKHEQNNALLVVHAMVLRAIRFLGYLSLQDVRVLNEQQIKEHEKSFFYTNNGKFIKIPHVPFHVNSRSLEFVSVC